MTLIEAAYQGKVEIVKQLLADNADPNQKSWFIPNYHGTAIFFTILNNQVEAEIKASVVETLLKYGAEMDLKIRVPDSKISKNGQVSLVDYLIEKVNEYLKLLDTNVTADTRKKTQNILEGIRVVLEIFEKEELLKEQEQQAIQSLLIDKINLSNPTIDPSKLYQRAIKELDAADRIKELPEIAKRICIEHLCNENFIPAKEWKSLIEHLVEISLTFEEVSQEAYGKKVSFIHDEGWLSQGWNEYEWFSDMIQVFKFEKVTKNANWDVILVRIIEEHKKYNGNIDDDLWKILNLSWVNTHASYEKIKNVAIANYGHFKHWLKD